MTEPVYRRTEPLMGTLVTIEVVGYSALSADCTSQNLPDVAASDTAATVELAFDWFRDVEACCSRFDPQSELSRLSATVGVEVSVSAVLFQAIQFALAVADRTGGAFDPTVGGAMEARGFNRNYRTGQPIFSVLARSYIGAVSYRDVLLNPERKSVTLLRPLLLDLGAVAKGLAIDMAAHELRPFTNFAINAGGDIYVAGHNRRREPWSVGIRHPRIPATLIDSLRVSDCAVCTSGDYERRCEPTKGEAVVGPGFSPAAVGVRGPRGSAAAGNGAKSAAESGGHHILDPRVGRSPVAAASATVVAPTAMLADALATAAFILGPTEGIALLERLAIDGLIISQALERYATNGLGLHVEPTVRGDSGLYLQPAATNVP
jgi:thiamine biosynthesis lipoprotein